MSPSHKQREIREWSDRLYALLMEMEEANGPDPAAATKLENLVRYAWDEARDAATRAEKAEAWPAPTIEELFTSG